MAADTGHNTKLALRDNERAWLDAYRERLGLEFPGLVEEITIYGPRARGDQRLCSEFNTLVIISEGDWFKKDAVGSLGHMVDMEGFFAVPIIMVYTRDEWLKRERYGSYPFQSVARGCVRWA